jgi:uncharacterized protein YegL
MEKEFALKLNEKEVEPRGIPKEIEKKVENNNLTELVFIIDKSGSMEGLEQDTIGGFNSMIEKQKKVDGKALVTTVFFSTYSIVIHDRVPIEEVKPLTEKDYFVGGCTALFDAVGGEIAHISDIHRYIRKEDVPSRTIFVITTDGEENASRKYERRGVKEMIERQEKEFGWEFLFLGANIDAVEFGSSFGIRKDRVANYNVKACTLGMYEELDKTLKNYRKTGSIRADWAENIENPVKKSRRGENGKQ